MTPIAFIAPVTARNLALVLVGGCYLGYHLHRLWRRRREKVKSKSEKVKSESKSEKVKSEEEVKSKSEKVKSEASKLKCEVEERKDKHSTLRLQLKTSTSQTLITHHSTLYPLSSTLYPLPGEDLYAQARTMPHQSIPDYEQDGEYLKLLEKSAEAGYPKAMAKLGDYALRRACLVEAYYWLWRAKKGGVDNINLTMQRVRAAWVDEGCEREQENEYDGFTREQGNIGYALLCIDTRNEVREAKAYLSANAPDFLPTN